VIQTKFNQVVEENVLMIITEKGHLSDIGVTNTFTKNKQFYHNMAA